MGLSGLVPPLAPDELVSADGERQVLEACLDLYRDIMRPAVASNTSAPASVITRQIAAFDGGRAGAAPARRHRSAGTGGGTSFTQPAIAASSLHPRHDRRRSQRQYRRDQMIPALPGPAIPDQAGQPDQVIADPGTGGQHGQPARDQQR